MKKKMITRSLLGFPIGIAIGYFITILGSLAWANGDYSPCAPELTASVIWEIDTWSMVKQTGIYFSIISAVMLPTAYFAYWMEHSVIGFVIYFGIFIFIFAGIWISMYVTGKSNVRKMNQKLSQVKNGKTV